MTFTAIGDTLSDNFLKLLTTISDTLIDFQIHVTGGCLTATSDTLMISKCMSQFVSRMMTQDNLIQVTRLQPPRPFLPFPLYLDTVLPQASFVKL